MFFIKKNLRFIIIQVFAVKIIHGLMHGSTYAQEITCLAVMQIVIKKCNFLEKKVNFP